jgi:hypothetical protein
MNQCLVRLKPLQWDVFTSRARFRVLAAGRRFGKTYLAIIELCRAAWKPGSLVWYVAPSYKQAKRIAWKLLKEITRPYWAATPNETDLRIELISGGTIALRGADNYDSPRGNGLDFVVLDEYASMAPEAWTEVLRPALADRQGSALFIGTPRGYNHFYELYQAAEKQPDWARFQYSTAEGRNVPLAEIEAATHELDERVFRQEFMASFENLIAGRAYPFFDRRVHVKGDRLDERYPLFWSPSSARSRASGFEYWMKSFSPIRIRSRHAKPFSTGPKDTKSGNVINNPFRSISMGTRRATHVTLPLPAPIGRLSGTSSSATLISISLCFTCLLPIRR